MRLKWVSYFQDTDGLIFVVDCADSKQISVAKMELFNALLSDEVRGVPLLVFANKQDIRGARPAAQLSEDLDLVSIKEQEWHIQACSAKTGAGLTEGLDWLAGKIRARQSVSNVLKSTFGIGS